MAAASRCVQGRLLALALSTALGGCLARSGVPVDPAVNFTAHRESRGLVVDRMADGQHAVLVPTGSLFRAGDPRFVLRRDHTAVAALWYPAAHVTVRSSTSPEGPLLGRVDAAWHEGAIHLTVTPAVAAPVATSAFRRLGGGAPSSLTWYASTVLDVRGVYRAELQDAYGVPVGWLRARISPYQAAPRIYDGVVPSSLDGALTVAAVAIVDQEVDYIEDHVVNDVYQGLHSSGGPGR